MQAESRMPYEINASRRHRIPKACCRVKKWLDYDAALPRRGDLTVRVTPAATIRLDAASQRPTRVPSAIFPDRCRDGRAAAAGVWPTLAPD